MAWLTWFALESTLALAAALFTANFTLLVMWRRTGRGRPLLAGLAVSILLLAIQGFVVTRREHAGRLLRTIERDLLTAQTTGLSAALADDFRTARMDKGSFLTSWPANMGGYEFPACTAANSRFATANQTNLRSKRRTRPTCAAILWAAGYVRAGN